MHKMQCVLTLLALYVGLVQSFSWDIVISRNNRLEFYNEGTFTYLANPTAKNINWITYDPLHNRILFKVNDKNAIFSYDIENGKTQILINLKPYSWSLVYDPARELLFASIRQGKMTLKSFLVKPGSDTEAEGNHVINLPGQTNGLTVDSCKGYIYWTTDRSCSIEKVHINASKIEVINDDCKDLIRIGLTIDPQTQKIYWAENKNNITVFFNADLDGNNKKTMYKKEMEAPNQISVSKDFIYWVDTNETFFWQIPKNTSLDIDADVEPKPIALDNAPTTSLFKAIASNYAIEEQTEGNPDCKAMQSLLPSIPRKLESRVSCDTCNVSVCHNYCLHGDCSVSADGRPKCRCNEVYSGPRCEVDACLGYCLHKGKCSLFDKIQPVCTCSAGYKGDRCEVDACLGYCLNEGVCSLNDKSQPVCRCSEGFEGNQCDVSVFLSKFFQQFVKKTSSVLDEVKTKMELLSTKE